MEVGDWRRCQGHQSQAQGFVLEQRPRLDQQVLCLLRRERLGGGFGVIANYNNRFAASRGGRGLLVTAPALGERGHQGSASGRLGGPRLASLALISALVGETKSGRYRSNGA